jgi:release factor glutamine methyltransferase
MLKHAAKVAFMFLCCMKTVKDVLTQFKQTLADVYDAQEIEAITMLTLSELLDTSKAKLKAFPETEITLTQHVRLENVLAALKTGQPLLYILGYTEFYGLKFNVNPSVLIPRPETEELVQWIIESVKASATPVVNLLDIGTGSGCIAITLKKYLPQVNVYAIDISAAALNTARQNAGLNEVEVNFIEADILNFVNAGLPKFDLIVSNPPYVTMTDKMQMHLNVTDFEPHTALFVPEEDPLLFYNAISNFAKNNLTAGGQLFFEINESYGKQTVDLIRDNLFINIELRQDLPGRDRMIKAINSAGEIQ